MMKLVVSLALLAVCSAYSYGSDYNTYHVQVGLDHIVVSNEIGHQVHINIQKHHGLTVGHDVGGIQVQFCAVQGECKTHWIHDVEAYDDQDEILHHIFRQFQGHLDYNTYEQLCHVVAKHVQSGDVHPAVLQALKALTSQDWHVYLQNWEVAMYPHQQWNSLYSGHGYHHQWNPTQSYQHHQGYYGPYSSGLSHWAKLFHGAHQSYDSDYSVGDVAGHHQGSHWSHHPYGQSVWNHGEDYPSHHWGKYSAQHHEYPVVGY